MVATNLPARSEQEHARGVVDAIVAAGLRDLGAEHAELLLDLVDLRRAFRSGRSPACRTGRRSAPTSGGPSRSGSTVTKTIAKASSPSPELAAQPGQPRQRRRADVGAMGEAEEDRERLAGELGARERLAVAVDEGERPADRRQRQLGRASAPAAAASGRVSRKASAAAATSTSPHRSDAQLAEHQRAPGATTATSTVRGPPWRSAR